MLQFKHHSATDQGAVILNPVTLGLFMTAPTFNDLPSILTQMNNNLSAIAQALQGIREQNVQLFGTNSKANEINANLLATLVQMASSDPVVQAANTIVSEAVAAAAPADAAPAKRKRKTADAAPVEDAAIKVSASFVAPEPAPAPVPAPMPEPAPAPVPAPMPAPEKTYEQKQQDAKDKAFGFGFGQPQQKPAFELQPNGSMLCNHLEGDNTQRYLNMTVEEQFAVLLGTAMPHMNNPAIRSKFLEFAATNGMTAPMSDPQNSSLPGAGYRAVTPEVRLVVLQGLLKIAAERTVI